ncbi:sensor histidine kinase [Geodermatophilus ruber]|uniref:sensor histidine kinase n=1 Tax=Geodermatophilus ruber TaxID=504800 RepID=UPI0015A56B97|nr:histidine kinase [Geodermatophilus ruber]
MKRITVNRSAGRPDRVSVAASVARFTAAGVVVTLLLAAVIATLASRAGMEEGTRSAEHVARVVAYGIVAPLLTPELLDGDEQQRTHLRMAVEAVAATGPITRVNVWDAEGRILWSDEPRLEGEVHPLDPGVRAALTEGAVFSAVADASSPDNRFAPPGEEQLEAYVGVRDRAGRPLLVEIDQGYETVEAPAYSAWMRFAPPALGGLLLLQLFQVPFAWRLALRLRRHQEIERRLLQSVVDASEAERRRIAAEVHDGVVQDLTGLTYDLDAARLGAQGSDDTALVTRTADRVRHSVTELRSLLVDLNPPRLPSAGLAPALKVLAEGLERSGVRVRLDVQDADDLPEPVATQLYRCALEALRNVTAHSSASRVQVTVSRADDDATVVVDDDGRGFDEVSLAASDANGHLGLRALGDRLQAIGGSLTVASAPGLGTRVEAIVPLGLPSASSPEPLSSADAVPGRTGAAP